MSEATPARMNRAIHFRTSRSASILKKGLCENCGEEYVDGHVAEKVLAAAEASARAGVRLEIGDYVAA